MNISTIFTTRSNTVLYITVWIYLLSVCGAAGANTTCPCNTSATWDALAALYRSTHGEAWFNNDKWLQTGSNVCEWYGLDYACTSLWLDGNNLTGTLPPELSFVAGTSLMMFDFSRNNLTGSLPATYKVLSQTSSFNTRSNQLSGTLPHEWSSWLSISLFDVALNALSGTLPASYSVWSNLRSFDVHSNQLSGTLPDVYSNWTTLSQISISSNNLTGTLPASYSAWTSLIRFSVYENELHGTLPDVYSNWHNLLFFFGRMKISLAVHLPKRTRRGHR